MKHGMLGLTAKHSQSKIENISTISRISRGGFATAAREQSQQRVGESKTQPRVHEHEEKF